MPLSYGLSLAEALTVSTLTAVLRGVVAENTPGKLAFCVSCKSGCDSSAACTACEAASAGDSE